MQRVRYEYTCDNCGEQKESSSEPKWLKLTMFAENEKRVGTWDFCTPECKAEWLKGHGFEVKE
jgi:hypothetical protein